MKKTVFALSLILLLCSNQALASDLPADIEEKIASIGFGKYISLEPKEQINKLFEKHEKYANKHNIKQLMSVYSPNYLNADKIGYEKYSELIQKTWESYPDIVYTSKIKSIDINGDYAIVQTHEDIKATAAKPSEHLKDKGFLQGESDIIYYLQKSGNKWFIVSDKAITEKTFLRYGEAKDIAFDIMAPNIAIAGQDYTILFAADAPKSKIILGSLTNEKIIYPLEPPKEVFRRIKDDGILERVVTANKDGWNEQAVISVGITKTEIDDNMDINLQVSGVAFLVFRVNVLQNQPIIEK